MISALNQMQKYILAFLLYMNNQSDLRSAVRCGQRTLQFYLLFIRLDNIWCSCRCPAGSIGRYPPFVLIIVRLLSG